MDHEEALERLSYLSTTLTELLDVVQELINDVAEQQAVMQSIDLS